MHAHQRRSSVFERSANQCDVLVMVHVARIRNHPKLAVPRRHHSFRHAPHIALVLHPVTDQARPRQHFQIVLFAKLHPSRHTRSLAALIHPFAPTPPATHPPTPPPTNPPSPSP